MFFKTTDNLLLLFNIIRFYYIEKHKLETVFLQVVKNCIQAILRYIQGDFNLSLSFKTL